MISKYVILADMAELADALDLGSSGRPCRFKSCYPHKIERVTSLDVTLSILYREKYVYNLCKLVSNNAMKLYF